jgi:micrococcal nuclease
MRPVLAALLVLLAVAGGWLVAAGAPGGAGAPTAGEVVFVPDGDTVHVRLDGTEQPVRVIGVDTPEIDHHGGASPCFGEEAGRFTRDALLHHRVRLVPGVEEHDRYGRLLAAVVPVDGPLAGHDLAETLASAGLARQLAIPPNDGNAARIAALVAAARTARRGLWAACSFAAAYPRVR